MLKKEREGIHTHIKKLKREKRNISQGEILDYNSLFMMMIPAPRAVYSQSSRNRIMLIINCRNTQARGISLTSLLPPSTP